MQQLEPGGDLAEIGAVVPVDRGETRREREPRSDTKGDSPGVARSFWGIGWLLVGFTAAASRITAGDVIAGRISERSNTVNAVAVTIELPPEAQAQLEAEASRRGISFDQLIVQLAAGLDETPAESNALGAFFGRATQATRNGPAVTSTSFGTSSPNDATSRPPDCGAAG